MQVYKYNYFHHTDLTIAFIRKTYCLHNKWEEYEPYYVFINFLGNILVQHILMQ